MSDIDTIKLLLKKFSDESSMNTLPEFEDMAIYEAPVVAVASATDPLYFELQKPDVISPEHMLPQDWLPGAKSVISYFLPFSEPIRRSNMETDYFPSVEWTYGRYEGEAFNNAVRKYLADYIISTGAKAVSPALDPRYKVKGYTSSWSERHTAFIAGLGTFNLSKSLITEKGCAGRFGSVITDLDLTPTERPYTDLYEYCNACHACIDRCPVHAISPEGKNHPPCHKFQDEMMIKFTPRYGCGKCQTGVPCEYGIPSAGA